MTVSTLSRSCPSCAPDRLRTTPESCAVRGAAEGAALSTAKKVMRMVPDLHLEDFAPGQRFRTRGMTLTESQIMEFAWAHDPQPFHIDKIAAAEGPYQGIIASGFQTLLVAFRLVYQERIINAGSMGAPGIDELRWLKPVRPGDTIRVEGEVREVRPSASRPDRGTVRIAYTALNQAGEPVMSWNVPHIIARRPAPSDIGGASA
jgi:acyl dehydratase